MDFKLDDIKNKLNTMENIQFDTNTAPITENNITPQKVSKLTYHYDKDLPPPDENRLNELRDQVIKLGKIEQPEQRSEKWYKMRNDMITASDVAAALGKNPYSSRKQLLRSKCGESKSFYGAHMQHGVKYEPVANMIYEYRNNLKIIDFGLLPHPVHSFIGASPDGITENGIMIEIKCPPKREITGDPPLYYWIQVQIQLEVCELDRCDFMECKIEEYSNSDEYFADINDNRGNEKGIVLEFLNKKTMSAVFIYSKIDMNFAEYEVWSKEEREKLLRSNSDIIYSDTLFWKLVDVSCVPVYRDKKWFEMNLPDLKKFWDDVLYYRRVGTDEIKVVPRKKKVIDTSQTKITDFINNSGNASNNNEYDSDDDLNNPFTQRPLFSNSSSGVNILNNTETISKNAQTEPVRRKGGFGDLSYLNANRY